MNREGEKIGTGTGYYSLSVLGNSEYIALELQFPLLKLQSSAFSHPNMHVLMHCLDADMRAIARLKKHQ